MNKPKKNLRHHYGARYRHCHHHSDRPSRLPILAARRVAEGPAAVSPSAPPPLQSRICISRRLRLQTLGCLDHVVAKARTRIAGCMFATYEVLARSKIRASSSKRWGYGRVRWRKLGPGVRGTHLLKKCSASEHIARIELNSRPICARAPPYGSLPAATRNQYPMGPASSSISM